MIRAYIHTVYTCLIYVFSEQQNRQSQRGNTVHACLPEKNQFSYLLPTITIATMPCARSLSLTTF